MLNTENKTNEFLKTNILLVYLSSLPDPSHTLQALY